MSNPAKQKGTGFEREVLRRLTPIYGAANVTRTSPGSAADLRARGLGSSSLADHIPVLYTRGDRGVPIVTLRASDFEDLLAPAMPDLLVQCKRYKRFSIHTIFEDFRAAVMPKPPAEAGRMFPDTGDDR